MNTCTRTNLNSETNLALRLRFSRASLDVLNCNLTILANQVFQNNHVIDMIPTNKFETENDQ